MAFVSNDQLSNARTMKDKVQSTNMELARVTTLPPKDVFDNFTSQGHFVLAFNWSVKGQALKHFMCITVKKYQKLNGIIHYFIRTKFHVYFKFFENNKAIFHRFNLREFRDIFILMNTKALKIMKLKAIKVQ